MSSKWITSLFKSMVLTAALVAPLLRRLPPPLLQKALIIWF